MAAWRDRPMAMFLLIEERRESLEDGLYLRDYCTINSLYLNATDPLFSNELVDCFANLVAFTAAASYSFMTFHFPLDSQRFFFLSRAQSCFFS